jgi:hypothetical protein
MRRLIAVVLAGFTLAVGSWLAAPPAAAQTYAACDGVWVVVDYGSLGGGVETGCATSFSTGSDALRGAGFSPTLAAGMVTRISGEPTTADIQKSYWSYWQATRKSDGSYVSWTYSSLGANATHPIKGNAEGWHYVSLSETASAPSSQPPTNPVASPAPAKTTAKPSGSATPTGTARASATPSQSAASTASTPPPTPEDSPSDSTEGSVNQSSSTDDGGSPLALIITGTIIVAGSASAGAWWLWRGRKR